jgi:ubiquinone biosynthesis protein Coq4
MHLIKTICLLFHKKYYYGYIDVQSDLHKIYNGSFGYIYTIIIS